MASTRKNDRRPAAKSLAALAALAASAMMGDVANAADAKTARVDEENIVRPNIVLIYTDDLGYGDVGCYGATKVKTPNIDRLAEQGRMFTDAHSPSVVCTPSRYSLLTGEYAWRKKIWGPLPYDRPLLIGTGKKTLPGLLKQNGYATACVGKWHLGFGKEGLTDWNKKLTPGPLEVGFDYFYGIPLVNSHAPFVYVENHHVVGLDPEDPFVLRQPNPAKPPNSNLPRSPVQEFPEKGGIERWSGATRAHELYRDRMVGTHLMKKSVAWIRDRVSKKKSDPFFLYFATPHIHHPFTPHPRFEGSSECGRYGDFIHELDWMVGEVLKTLDELKVAENTLVIFTSDNGGMLNDGGKDACLGGRSPGSVHRPLARTDCARQPFESTDLRHRSDGEFRRHVGPPPQTAGRARQRKRVAGIHWRSGQGDSRSGGAGARSGEQPGDPLRQMGLYRSPRIRRFRWQYRWPWGLGMDAAGQQ